MLFQKFSLQKYNVEGMNENKKSGFYEMFKVIDDKKIVFTWFQNNAVLKSGESMLFVIKKNEFWIHKKLYKKHLQENTKIQSSYSVKKNCLSSEQ